MENRRREYLRTQEISGERGALYVDDKMIVVDLIDKRPGGVGVFISPKRKFERVNLKKGMQLTLEMDAGNNKREKIGFEVVHIQAEGNGYKVGLKYADGSNLTNMQRGIMSANKLTDEE